MELRESGNFKFKIKGSVDDSGTFVGMGAVFGNVDLGGEGSCRRVHPNARCRQTIPIALSAQERYADRNRGVYRDVERARLLRVSCSWICPRRKMPIYCFKENIISGLSVGLLHHRGKFSGWHPAVDGT